MPLVEQDHPALARRSPTQSAFLSELENELLSARNRITDISQRLSDHGFYGPPEDTSSATPVESSTRGRVVEEIRVTSNMLGRIEYQLTQLLG